MKQTRVPVCAVKQSIYLDIYGYFHPSLIFADKKRRVESCERLHSGRLGKSSRERT
jgi:hypothetical protein